MSNDEVAEQSLLKAVPRSVLERFRPQQEWFAHRGGLGLHGVGHISRVLVWSQIFVPFGGALSEEDRRILGWAAAFHDVRRWDDGRDPEHGERAAEWTMEHLPRLDAAVDPGHVAYLCRWHFPNDAEAPAMTPLLQVMKDSDGVDRYRFSRPDAAMLRTSAAKRVQTLAIAEKFCVATGGVGYDNFDSAFDSVIGAAAKLGLVS